IQLSPRHCMQSDFVPIAVAVRQRADSRSSLMTGHRSRPAFVYWPRRPAARPHPIATAGKLSEIRFFGDYESELGLRVAGFTSGLSTIRLGMAAIAMHGAPEATGSLARFFLSATPLWPPRKG